MKIDIPNKASVVEVQQGELGVSVHFWIDGKMQNGIHIPDSKNIDLALECTGYISVAMENGVSEYNAMKSALMLYDVAIKKNLSKDEIHGIFLAFEAMALRKEEKKQTECSPENIYGIPHIIRYAFLSGCTTYLDKNLDYWETNAKVIPKLHEFYLKNKEVIDLYDRSVDQNKLSEIESKQ